MTGGFYCTFLVPNNSNLSIPFIQRFGDAAVHAAWSRLNDISLV